jgi:hypothetical protein
VAPRTIILISRAASLLLLPLPVDWFLSGTAQYSKTHEEVEFSTHLRTGNFPSSSTSHFSLELAAIKNIEKRTHYLMTYEGEEREREARGEQFHKDIPLSPLLETRRLAAPLELL